MSIALRPADPLALVLLLAVALALRSPLLLPSAIDWDETLYVLIADAWRRGGLPYLTIWDHKPLGAYLPFLVVQALFGPGLAPVRVLGSLLAGLAAYLIARLLPAVAGADDRATRRLGLATGLFYLLYLLIDDGLATNTELLFAPWLVGAALLAVRGDAATGRGRLAAIGLVMGVALQTKYVVAPELALFGLLLLARQAPARRVGAAVTLALGGIAPTALAFGYLAAQGQAALWLDANIWANARHGGVIAAGSIARIGAKWAVLHLPLLLAGGWLALRRGPWLVFAWIAAAAIGVAATGRFYGHYFIELLPPLCLALGLALRGLAGAAAPAVAALLLAALLPMGLAPLEPALRLAWRHGLTAAWAGADRPAEIARAIRARAGGGRLSLFVFDDEPVLYRLVGSPLPGRYVFPPLLTSAHFARVAGIDPVAELDAIMAKRPDFVVKLAARDEGIRDDRYNDAVYDRLAALLAADYVRVEVIAPAELWRRRD